MKSPLKSQHMPADLKKINPQREVEKPCEKRRNVKGHVDWTLTTEWIYVRYSECERCAERLGEHIARTRSREQSERSSQSPGQLFDISMFDTGGNGASPEQREDEESIPSEMNWLRLT
jgi:hypothetical protein